MIANQSLKPYFSTTTGTNSGQNCEKERLRPHIANLVAGAASLLNLIDSQLVILHAAHHFFSKRHRTQNTLHNNMFAKTKINNPTAVSALPSLPPTALRRIFAIFLS